MNINDASLDQEVAIIGFGYVGLTLGVALANSGLKVTGLEIISELMEVKVKIITSKAPKGETEKRCPDISKIKKLGYSPKFSIKDGLKKTIKWYLDNPFHLNKNKLL